VHRRGKKTKEEGGKPNHTEGEERRNPVGLPSFCHRRAIAVSVKVSIALRSLPLALGPRHTMTIIPLLKARRRQPTTRHVTALCPPPLILMPAAHAKASPATRARRREGGAVWWWDRREERNTPQCHPISSDCSVAAAFYCACALTGRLHIRSTVPSPLVTIVERERLGVERGRREQEPRAASPGRMWDALPF
jgi:hypothetical protein